MTWFEREYAMKRNIAKTATRIATVAFVFAAIVATSAQGDDRQDGLARDFSSEVPMASSFLPIQVPSLDIAGRYGDLLVFRNYRIQERVDRPNECQLLNGSNIKVAAGSFEQCRKSLDQIRIDQNLEPPSEEVTLLIHGILRHSRSMGKVRNVLEEVGMQAEPFDYPSARIPLEKSVHYLDTTLKNLGPEVKRINFVVHSMGGLLVRAYLQKYGDDADPRLHRLVMMGTPNKGAEIATMLKELGLFKTLYGPAGQQLIHADQAFVHDLPIPPFEFAVIAGSRGTESGWNPLIPGDDDGTVTVSSARLPGATDYRAFVTTHALMLHRRDVAEAAVRFLQTGSLYEDGHREPIPLPAETAPSE